MTNKLAIESALGRAGWIDTVLIAGVLLSATVCLLHLQKGAEFEILKVKLPLKWFPLFCVGYTAAHIYCTILFTQLCVKLSRNSAVWDALRWKGPLIFNGMHPRTTVYSIKSLPIATRIDFFDPTLWLFYTFCVIVYFGFVSSCKVAGYSVRRARWMAIGLLVANWLAGSVWSNAASILSAN